MREIQTPKFANYEEEAAFWDNFDTADYMPEDGWVEVKTDTKRPTHIIVLSPERPVRFYKPDRSGAA